LTRAARKIGASYVSEWWLHACGVGSVTQ